MIAQYTHDGNIGLLRADGSHLTEAFFDAVEEVAEGASFCIAYRERHPYIVRLDDGSIIDLFQVEAPDEKAALERVLNWTMPGLQLFYRDTDAPLVLEQTIRIGDVVRAGFFIDVSPYAGRPMHRYRYVIATAHAANLQAPDDRYPLHVLHYNSYFKVMDICHREEVTQVLLLHIPAKCIFSPWMGGVLSIQLGDEETLVDIARKSLDTKLSQPANDLLEETEWLQRTEWHVGVNREGELFSLFPSVIGVPDNARQMGQALRSMGSDTDDINHILEQ